MKRHEKLIPLTHDHHHALAEIRRLRLAAKGNEEERRNGGRRFLDFFNDDVIDHLREEEEVVLPLVVGEREAGPTVERALWEHFVIHAAVRSLERELQDGALDSTGLLRMASLLESHIRFEEKIVFPLIESLVSEARLASVALAPRNRAA